jgi:hypothetical protein
MGRSAGCRTSTDDFDSLRASPAHPSSISMQRKQKRTIAGETLCATIRLTHVRLVLYTAGNPATVVKIDITSMARTL